MGFAASALAPPASAQGAPKAPAAPPAPPIGPEQMPTLREALKPLEDPNPDRFKPTGPLFPKGPPGKPDGGNAVGGTGKTAPPTTMEEWKGW